MNQILTAHERTDKIKAMAKRLKFTAPDPRQPHIRSTKKEDFLIIRHKAEDGYITWHVRYTGRYRAAAGVAIVTTLKEAKEAIIAHRQSGCETWYPHLVR